MRSIRPEYFEKFEPHGYSILPPTPAGGSLRLPATWLVVREACARLLP